MNILETLLASARGGALGRAAETRGLGEHDVQSLVAQLVPALTAQMKSNASEDDGRGLASALGRGNHARYLDDGSTLASPEAVDDGNGILGHILGSKDVSRRVASEAGSQTGLSADVMKRMLPLVATLVMGAMSRQTAAGGNVSAAAAGPGGGLLDMLGGMLDSNKDGSLLDDVTGMLGRAFKRE